MQTIAVDFEGLNWDDDDEISNTTPGDRTLTTSEPKPNSNNINSTGDDSFSKQLRQFNKIKTIELTLYFIIYDKEVVVNNQSLQNMMDLINLEFWEYLWDYNLSKINKLLLNTFITPARQSGINTVMDSIEPRIGAVLINLIHFESIIYKDNEYRLSTVSHREFPMIKPHLLFHISQASDKMEMIQGHIHSSLVNHGVRNVFLSEIGGNGIVYGLLQTRRFVDFVLDIVNNVQQNYDNDLPYFMIVYHDDNHYTDGLHEFYLDKYVSKLIEYLNFDRTLLHMTVIGDRSSSFELFFFKKCLRLLLQPISQVT